MPKTKENWLCSNCHTPFHGTTACKRTVDGNDPLFVRISEAADALAELVQYATKRNQPELCKQADALYAEVLDLRLIVNVYAQPKEVK